MTSTQPSSTQPPSTQPSSTQSLSTQPAEPRPPALTPPELLRWAWRQLTSMRIALILLFLLALAAVPGSLVPQRSVDPLAVSRFATEHPKLTPLYQKLSLFDVFASPWFSAVYLLLFVSLVGCVVPRARQHARAMRTRPLPAAPRNLSRLPAWHRWESGAETASTLAAARTVLRSRRFRVATDPGSDAVRAEKGYLRETGNLVFHIALIGVLVAVAAGSLYGYKGSVLVVEGRGFANTLSQYDDFTPGRLFHPADLAPLSFTLEDFSATYQETGGQRGTARSFDAAIDYRSNDYRNGSDEPVRRYHIQVNKPLTVDGAKVFLIGHGYAPILTVTDGKGDVVYSGPTPFLPQDGNFASSGVVKAPDARPTQLGFSGFFLPTAARDRTEGIVSVFPGAENPAMVLLAWKGDLGLDDGDPQSVYQLDTAKLGRVTEAGKPVTKVLQAGDTLTLPDRLGSVRYDGYREWATFQVAHDPGKGVALGSAVVALAGLMLSLFVRRRRVWVRVTAGESGRTVVEVAGLARSEAAGIQAAGLAAEVDEIAEELRRAAPEAGSSPEHGPEHDVVNAAEKE